MQNHLKAIFAISAITKESFGPLRKLLDQSTQHLQSLAALNQPPEKRFDDLIVHLISDKFDNNTPRQWEASIGFKEFLDWEKLKIFLTYKCNILEMELLSTTNKTEKTGKSPESHFINKVSH